MTPGAFLVESGLDTLDDCLGTSWVGEDKISTLSKLVQREIGHELCFDVAKFLVGLNIIVKECLLHPPKLLASFLKNGLRSFLPIVEGLSKVKEETS